MKKVFALLLSLLLLLSLSSCGKNNGDVPPRQDAGQSEPSDANPEPDMGDTPLLPDPDSTGNDMVDIGENSGTISISHTDVTLKSAGDSFRLSVLGVEGIYACAFSSADPAVASVDEATGEVTAAAPGQTTVSAHIECSSGQYDFDCIVRCAWTEAVSGEEVLASLPGWFRFSSGVGAWSTEVHIAADGSFTGLFSDANAGEAGEDYVSTVYYCRFSGTFSTPVRVDDYTYSMNLESMVLEEEPGQESIDGDGTRWVSAAPYGLDGADEVLILLPGAKVVELPEYFVNWTHYYIGDSETLPFCGLYNVAEGFGFSSVA